jgi:hypothetical protein
MWLARYGGRLLAAAKCMYFYNNYIIRVNFKDYITKLKGIIRDVVAAMLLEFEANRPCGSRDMPGVRWVFVSPWWW